MSQLAAYLEKRNLKEDISSSAAVEERRYLKKAARDYLKNNRGIKTIDNIRIAISARKDLLLNLEKDLLKDDDIIKEKGGLRYKAKYDHINNINDLKDFLLEKTFGILRTEIEDVYINVHHDINKLIDQQFIIEHVDEKREEHRVLVPIQRIYELNIDPRLKNLFEQIKLPQTRGDLETKMIEKNYVPKNDVLLENYGRQYKTSKIKHVRKRRKIQNLTNKHLINKYDWIKEGI